jgi:3-hydroxybutyrate dehydrogenase
MSGGGATDLEEGLPVDELTPTHGAAVVVSGKSPDKGAQALDEMAAGDRASFVQCDVREQASVENLVDETVKRYGSVDILVNNAGGTDGWALIHELSDAAWQNALNWNLNAVFWATRRVLPHMLEKKWGRIINISSVEGKQANKAAVSHYITNKHAINGFTKAVAFEYGALGITCNAICPGAVEMAGITYEQFLDNYAQEAAIKRLNTVEEVAAMAALLASGVGGGITGALLNVDGGTAQW